MNLQAINNQQKKRLADLNSENKILKSLRQAVSLYLDSKMVGQAESEAKFLKLMKRLVDISEV